MADVATADVGMEVDPNLATEANEALAPPAAAPGAGSPPVKAAPGSVAQAPSVGVKPDLATKPVSDSVPYTRFQQVNEDAKRYRQMVEQQSQMLAQLQAQQKSAQPQAPDPNTVSDQEWLLFSGQGLQGGFTDKHWSVFEKVMSTAMEVATANAIRTIEEQFADKEMRERTWADTVKEFPEAGDKESELYQLADQIAQQHFLQRDRNGRTFISPQNQYDAVLRAARQLDKQKAAQAQATTDAEVAKQPIAKQNAFIGTKAAKGTRKSTYTDKEFEKLSPDEQEAVVAQQASEAGFEI